MEKFSTAYAAIPALTCTGSAKSTPARPDPPPPQTSRVATIND
jgi:hypothetical protein